MTICKRTCSEEEPLEAFATRRCWRANRYLQSRSSGRALDPGLSSTARFR